jgi:hypothetical protein
MKSVRLLANLQILFFFPRYIPLVADPTLLTQFENVTDDDIFHYRFLIFVSKSFGRSRPCNLPLESFGSNRNFLSLLGIDPS